MRATSSLTTPVRSLCIAVNLGLFVAGLRLYTDAQGIHGMLPLIILGAVTLIVLGLGFLMTRLFPAPPANRAELLERVRRLR